MPRARAQSLLLNPERFAAAKAAVLPGLLGSFFQLPRVTSLQSPSLPGNSKVVFTPSLMGHVAQDLDGRNAGDAPSGRGVLV